MVYHGMGQAIRSEMKAQRGHKVMKKKNLFEEKKEYQALLQSVTDYVIAINRNYQIIMANDLFINKLGARSEGFCYKAWKNRDDKCDDCLVEKSFRDGRVHQNEEAIVLKNGRIAQMLIKSTPVKDDQGKIVYVLEAATDITEKKRLQQELINVKGNLETIIDARLNHLQKSEEKYRTIFERSRDALILTDSNSKIMEINREGVEILGYRNKEDLLDLTSVKELFKDPEEFYQFQKQAFGEGVVTEFEVRLVGWGKRSFDALITSNVILDLVGRITGYVMIIRDITKIKEAQEQVIRTEKLASLGKLAATVAHEINNPLAAVLTYIRLMIKLMKRGQFTPERLENISRYLTIMESETARCGEIVKNLLVFSRQSKITMETSSIEELIEKTLPLISHDLEMKNIQLVKEIEPNLPKIKCGFRHIQQALLNLLSNASEAMQEGGTLTVIAKRSKSDDFVEAVICDTGCGIPEEDLKNIFEPFFTTKEEGKGVGLGLSVVHGIITRHNGSIDVESELQKGSAFKVRLPTAR
jgi:PAS domain S-box-containing protein